MNERSVEDVSRFMERRFGEAGEHAGAAFSRQLGQAFGGLEKDSQAALDKIVRQADVAGAAIGAALIGGATGAVLALEKIGDQFEIINRGIMTTTAATGAALEDLKSHADALVGTLDTSAGAVGSTMGTLATRLTMEAGPALDTLTRHVTELGDRFGRLDAGALAGAFTQFGVGAAQADDTLASLLQTSREYAVNLGDLTTNIADNAAVFTELNLNMEQSGHLVAELTARHLPLQQAVLGLEVAEKAAAKAGEPLPEFIARAAASMEYYHKIGNDVAANEIAVAIFAQRRWAQGKIAADAYLETVKAGPDAWRANAEGIDKFAEGTETLHNAWQKFRNEMDVALQGPATGFIDDLTEKLKQFGDWAREHQQDLANLFHAASTVAGELITALMKIAEILGSHPGLIQAITGAFVAWETIKGIETVLTGLRGISALLTGLPAEATAAGAGVSAGLAPAIAALSSVASGLAIWNLHGSAPGAGQPGGTPDTKRDATRDYAKAHGDQMPPGTAQWLAGTGPMPPELGPYYVPGAAPGTPFFDAQGRPLNADGSPVGGPNAGPPNPTPYSPDMPKSLAPGPPKPPTAPDGIPGGLLTPDDLDPKKGKKGPRLPEAPQVPYGAGFGAPPEIGETEKHYAARQALLEKQHALAEDQARLDQLEKTSTATAEDIQKVKNKILADQGDIYKAEGELYAKEEGSLKRHGDALEEVGAKIDKDFGISKGLPGIAENLFKFLANLAAAPVFGALGGANAAIGGDTHGGKGLLGAAALAGAFGPQFTPEALAAASGRGGGATGWTGTGWGGPAAPGLGGRSAGWGGIPSTLPGGGAAPAGMPGGGGQAGPASWAASGVNLSTIPVAVQKYANDCIDASARIILSHSGVNMSEDQLKGVIAPGGSIDSQAAGMNALDPAGGFTAMAGSGGSQAAMFAAIKASIDSGTGSILNVAPGSSIAGRTFSDGHFIAATGYNPDGTINLSDTARGTQYSVSAADAFQATRGRGIVAGTGSGPPRGPSAAAPTPPRPPAPPLPGLSGPAPRPGVTEPAPGDISGMMLPPPHYAEGGSISGEGGDANGGTGGPKLPDWWRKVLSSSIGGEGPPIGIDNSWMPNAGGVPPGLWWQYPHLTPGYADGGALPNSGGGIPIMAHEGEHVLTKDDVSAMGGQSGVYAMRESLHPQAGGTGPQQAPQPPPGPQAPMVALPSAGPSAPRPGGPQPGPSMIGAISPSAGYGSGFQVTGGGLVGVAESLPATAISMGMAAAAAALYGGAIEDLPGFLDGGDPSGASGGGGGGTGGSPGGAGGGGSPGSSSIGALIGIGMQELNEAISKGGQATGALVGGLQQTFGPGQFAQSKLAQSGWISKLVGGFTGAQPQLPNMAGPKGGTPGLTPEQAASQQAGAPGAGGAGDNVYHGDVNNGVHIENYNATGSENRAGADLGRSYNAAVNAQTGSR